MGGVLNLGKAFHDELTGKIVVVMLFLVLFAVAFVIFLHLYAKWYIRQYHASSSATATDTTTTSMVVRRRRVDFSPGYYVESSSSNSSSISAVHHHKGGLDPTVLDSIPVVSFDHQKAAAGGMECAVCLSDVSEGEKLRILPKCHHGFHVECIDMWFHSHQTCPLCRIIIDPNPKVAHYSSETTTLDSILQATRTQNVVFPTNVLFWGNHTQQQEEVSNTRALRNNDDVDEEEEELTNGATSLSSETVAIDMPRQAVVEETSSEAEQAVGLVTVRLRSLRRLLTRDRTVYPSCTTTADTTSIQL